MSRAHTDPFERGHGKVVAGGPGFDKGSKEEWDDEHAHEGICGLHGDACECKKEDGEAGGEDEEED